MTQEQKDRLLTSIQRAFTYVGIEPITEFIAEHIAEIEYCYQSMCGGLRDFGTYYLFSVFTDNPDKNPNAGFLYSFILLGDAPFKGEMFRLIPTAEDDDETTTEETVTPPDQDTRPEVYTEFVVEETDARTCLEATSEAGFYAILQKDYGFDDKDCRFSETGRFVPKRLFILVSHRENATHLAIHSRHEIEAFETTSDYILNGATAARYNHRADWGNDGYVTYLISC